MKEVTFSALQLLVMAAVVGVAVAVGFATFHWAQRRVS